MSKKKSTINPEDEVADQTPANVIVQPADEVNDLTVGEPE